MCLIWKVTFFVIEKCIPRQTLEFVKFPSPVIATPGGTVSFCARLRNADQERPKVSWEVAGVPVTVGGRFQVRLRFHCIFHTNYGLISCFLYCENRRCSWYGHQRFFVLGSYRIGHNILIVMILMAWMLWNENLLCRNRVSFQWRVFCGFNVFGDHLWSL